MKITLSMSGMECCGEPECCCDDCTAKKAEAQTKPFTFGTEDFQQGFKRESIDSDGAVPLRRQRTWQ